MAARTYSSDQTELPEVDSRYSTCSTPPNDEEIALPATVHRQQKERDSNLVGWDGDHDPENPLNWSDGYKWWITFQLSMLALAASLGSSIIAPAQNAIAEYVDVSQEVTVLVISLYV